MASKRIVIGISGASGAPIAVELLRQLKRTAPSLERHLIITKSAEYTIKEETDYSLDEVKELATVVYDNESVWEGPASGSYKTDGMIVVPCSMKTLAGIVSGYSDSLLLRAADVTLKKGESFCWCREKPHSVRFI
jgi:4-hydroxy-3-polyprenylbenzoate decarboxylase